MPSQGARAIALLCVVPGLVGSPGRVLGNVAGNRELLERIARQIRHGQPFFVTHYQCSASRLHKPCVYQMTSLITR